LNPKNFGGFTLLSVCVKNCVCLSHGVQATSATWWASARIVAGVGDLVQSTGDGQARVGYSVAGQLRDQVTLCVVCTVYKETRSTCFLVWPQNQGRRFLPVWPQNRWLPVFQFGHQNWQLQFVNLDHKIAIMVSWFGP
jgi:hypothetical protein